MNKNNKDKAARISLTHSCRVICILAMANLGPLCWVSCILAMANLWPLCWVACILAMANLGPLCRVACILAMTNLGPLCWVACILVTLALPKPRSNYIMLLQLLYCLAQMRLWSILVVNPQSTFHGKQSLCKYEQQTQRINHCLIFLRAVHDA